MNFQAQHTLSRSKHKINGQIKSDVEYTGQHTTQLHPITPMNLGDMDTAMEHIVNYGSSHTESIITKNEATAQRFLKEVDASAVMVNASTRFNDGFQFGLGAEMGISTTRIHARGPMGLEELTCQKFIVLGDGQVRE